MKKSSSKSSSTAVTTPNVPSYLSGAYSGYTTDATALHNANPMGANMGASGLQQQAFSRAGLLGGGSDEAMNAQRGLLNYNPERVAAGSLADTDLSKYYNPWESQVIDNSVNEMNNARMRTVNGTNASTGRGAWNGSRQGVSDSLTNQGYMDSVSSMVANLRSLGFQNAQRGAQFDIGNRLTADQFNSTQGLAGANLRLNAANSMADDNRANIDQQASLGGTQREIDIANDPYMRQLAALAQYGGLLGQVPIDSLSGRTTTETGKSSGSGFGIGWNARNGLSFGG